ncbi:hypothetical protein HHK36_009970 [Tetracentron sinense]|uniref:Carboxypeptidase n=1 Tax=Tetracentron sinense TaxID=13715 RepID=A0A835DIN3_TETSI|nr:hypothetical protein HHK36_009970 [Tetracentron sinense]
MGGKLWLFWKENTAFDVVCKMNQMITGWFSFSDSKLLVTFIYAKCNQVERRELWQSLEDLNIGVCPWLVAGDFNIIRNDDERIGGHPRAISAMAKFNNCLESCGLLDLPCIGGRVSWCNGQEGSSRSWAKLDRVINNSGFSNIFSEAWYEYLPRKSSDHCPMVLRLRMDLSRYGPSVFRFQNMWCEDSFRECVETVWRPPVQGSGLVKLAAKLKKLKVALSTWNKSVFGHVEVHLKELEGRLEGLERQLQDGFSTELEAYYLATKIELEAWEHREELRLAQIAKKAWMVDGDKNSKFFHAVVNQRRKNNFISSMTLVDGTILSTPEQVHQGAVLFSRDPFRGGEVKEALLSIPKHSSPGPDGFGSGFFSSCWELVKDDVVEAAKEFFSGVPLPRFYTSSYIVLIPKAKYVKKGHVALASDNGSRFWKSVMGVLPEVLENVRLMVKEGKGSFWYDRWLSSGPLSPHPNVDITPALCIKDLWVENSWDRDKLVELVGSVKTEEIVQTIATGRNGENVLVWMPSKDGKFSSASAWDRIRVRAPQAPEMKWIWHGLLPKRVSVCVWKSRYDCLPVDENICRVGIQLASKCDCCVFGQGESQDHVLSSSEFAGKVWALAEAALGISVVPHSWWSRVFQWWSYSKNSTTRGTLIGILPCVITWRLCLRRCKARMEGIQETVEGVWLAVKACLRNISGCMKKHGEVSSVDMAMLAALEFVTLVGIQCNYQHQLERATKISAKMRMKVAVSIWLLLSFCLLAFITFNDANQIESLDRLITSRRSENRPRIDSWGELDAIKEYSPVYIGKQDGLMQADKIDVLPGQPEGVDFDQYAGYVTVDPKAEKALFYYFVEAPQNSSIKPLVLWLNGGPGCSSLGAGAMLELGPFRVNSDGKTLFRNEYAWNDVANVIFLESPAGVGFSYSNKSSVYDNTGDKSTAKDAYTFLVNWLERFPQYKTRDFFITGESYAGHYVPQLAYTILLNNKNTNQTYINLKGIAIGNALIDDSTYAMGMYDYFWTHALNSEEANAGIHENCDFVNENTSTKCDLFQGQGQTEKGRIYIYNIYAPRCHYTEQTGSTGSVNDFDPCSKNYVLSYLNLAEVQRALHANATTWYDCSGDIDGRLPVTSSRYSVNSLKLPIETAWRPWYTNNEVGGYVVAYKGVIFATVRGAGHLVPSYQPERALTMISSFLQGRLPPSS